MKRDYTDAEFEVVAEGRPAEPAKPSWNGMGLHPDWPTWGVAARTSYVVFYLAGLVGIWFLHHWLMSL